MLSNKYDDLEDIYTVFNKEPDKLKFTIEILQMLAPPLRIIKLWDIANTHCIHYHKEDSPYFKRSTKIITCNIHTMLRNRLLETNNLKSDDLVRHLKAYKALTYKTSYKTSMLTHLTMRYINYVAAFKNLNDLENSFSKVFSSILANCSDLELFHILFM